MYKGEILDRIKGNEYEGIKEGWSLGMGDENRMRGFGESVRGGEMKGKG
ncbi:hypothetical protein [Staphylococcus saprophyticus]|nr:hypothetical protein [Staphylococcus saprophyticus]